VIRRLDNLIREEYQKGGRHLLLKDKQWLSHPMQTVFDYTPVEKEQWLASVDIARLKWTCRRESARTALDASRKIMQNWLTGSSMKPVPPTSNSSASSIAPQTHKTQKQRKKTRKTQKNLRGAKRQPPARQTHRRHYFSTSI
jgi:hypothetical protein